MKILFTGGSSFTGLWFIKALAEHGHEITTIFPREEKEYTSLRKERVMQVKELSSTHFNCPFGSDPFFKLLASQKQWDLLCHHAAYVQDYKSPQFNIAHALANNTHRIEEVLMKLKEKGCQKMVVTGTVFEQGEGEGTEQKRAVSPYGLSKGLSWEVFKYYTQKLEMKLGKFVIPNPFGPYEEPRFTTYLIQTWYNQETAEVRTPQTVRDNIPATLLSKAYAQFSEQLTPFPGIEKLNPSFYTESQAAFTARFAKEMEKRLPLKCAYTCAEQTNFDEPQIRINTDHLDPIKVQWTEADAWDSLATFYETHYAKNT